MVMQHPESQVLGSRVADDVVWGLPAGATTDVSQLLSEVGLDGLAERDTGSLSGVSCSGWRWRRRWHASPRYLSPTKSPVWSTIGAATPCWAFFPG
ncbi:hypothetical protein I552_9796 [Mycobacterium xenopi 3993]|nr:hypothetical protein I552_9796 [Mycobacterium xenopi 3993]